ncbi:homocitrate synthase NifV [Anaerobacterium chartisolvens]|uniref:Homocitrate synthase NifV n=1 Tax=Anaerobacterium chartisolvens TaxID=1297424 RepID=A0A369ATM3_9FIRM|nr:homocitrate synthase [Anaerobacterium chartisolvens]RCX12720.1 homocitrate synthase NifV [Anaerobacterium chartisolvens]
MGVEIVDTTLRDGEQKAGIAFAPEEKIRIASMLDELGIYQIEAGIPAMGGHEKRSIARIAGMGLKSKISTWSRMNKNDINQALECGAEIIHISVPCSDIQIFSKLNKSREWVIDNMKSCIAYAAGGCSEVTIGMEDASRADFKFLMQVMAAALENGVKRVRYADTVGVLYRQRIYNEIVKIRNELDVEIEMHAHNDLGMAVANSIAAAKAGARYIDCTIGGIGERAGNCSYNQFIEAAREHMGIFQNIDLNRAMEIQADIMKIIYR